ncbi:cell envelope biogenesis protein OmpA [bacterium]|nr:cell envelope biogenesis protein OmpA [bacterium]
MKNSIYLRAFLGCTIALFFATAAAQTKANYPTQSLETDNYEKLKNLGYSEQEICEDLGNANFLLEKFDNAVFWYKKLMAMSTNQQLDANYQTRYEFALKQSTGANSIASNKSDWLTQIKNDYQLKRTFEKNKEMLSDAEVYNKLDFQPNLRSLSLDYLVEYERKKAFRSEASRKKKIAQPMYEDPVAVTADGNTAYFSKVVYQKPSTGVFSKKEMIYKIYRTDKINGQWKNLREMALTPKYSSAKHPAISEDGKRLFFASDMPGSFGKYDIYAVDLDIKGKLGQSKNLGTKVNTKKNDLYPSIIEGNTLVFASEGREGHGGLDLFMTEIGTKKVGWATNLGSPINSSKDDFSMYLMSEKGIGYVVSNRGKDKNELQQVAFSFAAKKRKEVSRENELNFKSTLNKELKIDYTTSFFNDND